MNFEHLILRNAMVRKTAFCVSMIISKLIQIIEVRYIEFRIIVIK